MAECDASGEAPTLAQEAVLVKSEEMPKGSMTVRGYDFDESRGQVDYHALLQSYRLSGFQAMNFGLAVEQISLMVCTWYGASLMPRPCMEWGLGMRLARSSFCDSLRCILAHFLLPLFLSPFPLYPSLVFPPSFSLLPFPTSLFSHISPRFSISIPLLSFYLLPLPLLHSKFYFSHKGNTDYVSVLTLPFSAHIYSFYSWK